MAALMIAGTHSGAGKTTLTMGLLAAFVERGETVQSFKTGPDYIDPTFHRRITGRACSNLDTWMMDEATVKRLYSRAMEGATMGIVEGVMGLFDGAAGQRPGGAGSSADLARRLGLPILLVIDARSAAQSVAAVVHGFTTLDPSLRFAGIVINRIGSERHGRMIREAIEHLSPIPVLGCLPRDAFSSLPERHLGLVSAEEATPALRAYWKTLAKQIALHIDLDRLRAIMRDEEQATGTAAVTTTGTGAASSALLSATTKSARPYRMAIARDRAFHFYYDDALRDLADMGIEWVPFQPAAGETFAADVDGIYLGGGYPELYLAELSNNQRFWDDLRHAHRRQLPIFAECGGYMSLCTSISDGQESYAMGGLIPATCRMLDRRKALGYVHAEIAGDHLLGPAGTRLRGHEFHYSDVTFLAEREAPAFWLQKNGEQGEKVAAGYRAPGLTASYLHVHLSAFPQAREALVQALAGRTR
ncbi:cobyrinate a,c-diamide synthase [Heliophilum fasciatum]|uniref:Cobyrinate a,c-diamide synthase n=1 Tax=Heliophilum fasciatum TaxID=35700 RepID=A0A4V2SWU5_9FIRM|nr:cobyrinate a,c-diamide synthase [Heliophilum fasciatum]MCW2278541.1 cobyrinic acid a,c-diamide synthase [Heliophilum fasciatum]TCP63496.1 cobyrinic acid a,c-diamide synthase [Heliophilum fasciatum]